MTNLQRELSTATLNIEALHELSGEGFRIYTWMCEYLPKTGYEISCRDLGMALQISPSTVNKHINYMVANGWLEKHVDIGMTATYKILK